MSVSIKYTYPQQRPNSAEIVNNDGDLFVVTVSELIVLVDYGLSGHFMADIETLEAITEAARKILGKEG